MHTSDEQVRSVGAVRGYNAQGEAAVWGREGGVRAVKRNPVNRTL